MVIAVIPVLGRYPLVPYTIRRLNRIVDKVICVVESDKDRQICADEGAFICNLARKPLGEKWNAGFWEAKQFDPDYILYVGSSDWVSDNWLDLTRYDAEIIGTLDYHLLHLRYQKLIYRDTIHRFEDDYDLELMRKSLMTRTVKHWKGYTNWRKGEPIGIGRLVRRDYLQRVNWNPFDSKLHKNLDFSMIQKAKSIKTVMSGEVQSLAVSTSLWSNKHEIEGDTIDNEYLSKWFPEGLKLF